ncbi:hypothetical protein [Geothrix sp. PMB-07]|nr:hypothetical protein [Geothrix sp. PMB-07]WLT30759.1 hypothetical protein Q9293_13645 [Geothrix sp. PMB-07]WLT32262.1 hypothetical protein Q9293_02805 [Geothrix sp. PMB-07]
MKTITVYIEVPEERALEGFHEVVEACADDLINADEATLTVRLREREQK